MSKFDIEKIKKINFQTTGKQLAIFWKRFFKLILSLFLLLMIVTGAYFWYFNLYHRGWSEVEKNNFLNTQFKDADLKVETLEKVIQKIDSKQEKFDQETFSAKNIFKAN